MASQPVIPPRMSSPVADTHAHLVMLDDPAGALERAARAGLGLVVTVADATEAPRQTFDLLDGWLADARSRLAEHPDPGVELPQVRIIVGAHPHNASSFTPQVAALLEELLADPRVAGLGEIGLDYHYDHSPREMQRDAFRAQLEIARRSGLPAVIHLREAHDDGLEILQEAGLPPEGAVLHCFTGDAQLARPFLDMGCYVSFAGPVTFKKADAIREAAAAVPLERLLTETDCPFMAPEPNRGTSNEPAWTVFTLARIASERGLPAEELARVTYDNALAVFGSRG